MARIDPQGDAVLNPGACLRPRSKPATTDSSDAILPAQRDFPSDQSGQDPSSARPTVMSTPHLMSNAESNTDWVTSPAMVRASRLPPLRPSATQEK